MGKFLTPSRSSGPILSRTRAKKLIGVVAVLLALWFFFEVDSSKITKPLISKRAVYVDSKTGMVIPKYDPNDLSGSGTGSESKKSVQELLDAKEAGAKKKEQKKTIDGCVVPGERVKATFVTLARNSELYELLGSIRQVEDRFNRKFNYDWVFLNDEPFTDEFKEITSAIVSGTTKYGLVPKEHWSFPEWIDKSKAAKTREEMSKAGIIYGDSVSYRHMCRYQSGFFFMHPLMEEYDWYWRVEPGIKIHCDLNYDLFKYMEDNEKMYGFTISIHEYESTIKTLWKHTKDFIKLHPEYVAPDNLLKFISHDEGETYNMCHFWSNFEIGSMKFLKSPAYMEYFEYLDKQGGFFYERWGDAPIHSIAVALFMSKDKVHFFNDVGYTHHPYTQCPIDPQFRMDHRCDCSPKTDFTWRLYSCGRKYYNVMGMEKPDNWLKYQ